MPDVAENTLKRNIGWLPGSAMPGQEGLCVLMGHRDLIARQKAPPKACPCFDVNAWWQSIGHRSRLTPRESSIVVPIRRPTEDDIQGKDNPSLLTPERIKVNKGDTLGKIALQYGLSVAELKRLNNKTSDLIRIGEKLRTR